MPSSNASPNTSQTPQGQAQPDLDALICDVAALSAKIKGLEAVYKEALAALLDAHAQGLVRSKFTAFDTDFNLTPGRSSWTYDDDVVKEVKAMQEWAQTHSKATMKQGSPFWTLKRTRA